MHTGGDLCQRQCVQITYFMYQFRLQWRMRNQCIQHNGVIDFFTYLYPSQGMLSSAGVFCWTVHLGNRSIYRWQHTVEEYASHTCISTASLLHYYTPSNITRQDVVNAKQSKDYTLCKKGQRSKRGIQVWSLYNTMHHCYPPLPVKTFCQ